MATLAHPPLRHHHHHHDRYYASLTSNTVGSSKVSSRWHHVAPELKDKTDLTRQHYGKRLANPFLDALLDRTENVTSSLFEQSKSSIFRREVRGRTGTDPEIFLSNFNASDVLLTTPFLRFNGSEETSVVTFGDETLQRTVTTLLPGNTTDSFFFKICVQPDEEVESPSRVIYSIIVPLMLFFCALSSVINLVIVFSIRWCRKPLSPTLYFSISLALADAFASLVLGTGLVVNSLMVKVYNLCPTSECFSLALEAFRLGGVLITVAHLLALAINHWFGIVRPLQYESTMTRGTALRIIILSWVCPIIGFLLSFSVIEGQGFQSSLCEEQSFLHRKVFHGVFGFFFFFPLILMTFIYGHVFIIVRDHLRHRVKLQGCTQLNKNVKAIVTTFLILGTYIICWMPAVLWYVLVCTDCLITKVDPTVILPINITINILIILKAVVNPIIYAARMQDIQSALKKMRYESSCWILKLCSSRPEIEREEIGSVRFTKSFRMTSRASISQSNL